MTGDHLHAGDLLADDALLDALANPADISTTLDLDAQTQPLAGLLQDWRRELDTAADATPTLVLPAGKPPASRGRGHHRRATRTLPRTTAVAVGLVVALAGGGVAAAAASGPTGPLGALHRVLFGPSQPADPIPARVAVLLDDAARAVAAAQRVGSITANARQRVTGQLDQAAKLLRGDSSSADRQRERLMHLRQLLAALPAAPAPTPMPTASARHAAPPLHSASATSAAPRPSPTATASRTPAPPTDHGPTHTAPSRPATPPPSSAGTPRPTPTPSSTRNGGGDNGGNGGGDTGGGDNGGGNGGDNGGGDSGGAGSGRDGNGGGGDNSGSGSGSAGSGGSGNGDAGSGGNGGAGGGNSANA